MYTHIPLTKCPSTASPAVPLLPKPADSVPKTHTITITFAAEHSINLIDDGQAQQYFIPSSGPLWKNPLNDL
jgi:hypothetical protein